jgi:hypothetical protein
MFTGLVAPRRDSAGDVALDSRQQSSSFGDSPSHESGSDSLSFEATRHYSSLDPVSDAPKFLWACSCGARPVLRFKGASQPENMSESDSEHSSVVAPHVVVCPACGRSGKPGFDATEAITDWNRSNLYLDLNLDEYEVLPDASVPGAEQLTAEATLSTRSLAQVSRPPDSQVETTEQERP